MWLLSYAGLSTRGMHHRSESTECFDDVVFSPVKIVLVAMMILSGTKLDEGVVNASGRGGSNRRQLCL